MTAYDLSRGQLQQLKTAALDRAGGLHFVGEDFFS